MESKKEALAKFATEEYPIHILGKHVVITDAMKTYAVEKLKHVKRFGGRVIEAFINMDIQKQDHIVDFIILVNNTKIKVTGKSINMYAAVDEAVNHLESKLRKYVDRLHYHHGKKLAEIDLNVHVLQRPDPLDEINDMIDEETITKHEMQLKPHPIVSKKVKKLSTLNEKEAIMKMELSGYAFLVYRSEEDRKLKVIYRLEDENYGVIQIE